MGEKVLACTFFLNDQHIVILFDSRASHDFISSTCANKARLTLVSSGTPYVISTHGGRVDVDWIVQKVPLDLVYHPRNELDEVAQGHTRHIREISATALTRVWEGNSTPSHGLSHQGILTSCG
jgi:hypothetical protein